MDKNLDNVFLIGPFGAGKSSVAKALAKKSRKTFFDSDRELQQRTGVSLSWIIEVETEAGFHKRETAILDELTAMHNIVLSTSGGCIESSQNRALLTERGIIVYLQISLEQQLKRTKRKDTRPLLDVPEPKKKLIELNQRRIPLYEEIADITINTDTSAPTKIARLILNAIDKQFK